VSDAAQYDSLVAAICLGIPTAIVVNAAFRSPRRLYLDEWMTLLTVPMTIFQLLLLGRVPWVYAGSWLAVSLWVRLTYCATIFCISLSACFAPVARRSQLVARLFALLYSGLLCAAFIFGLVFGVPFL
jgi:hypothetical protein